MIFCTWSCDDFGSDVYCRQDGAALFIHVARAVYETAAPVVPSLALLPREGTPERAAFIEQFCNAARQRDRWLSEVRMVPVGGDLAGEMFVEFSVQAAVRRLFSIRDAGYRVPQKAIDGLRFRDALALDVAMAEARA